MRFLPPCLWAACALSLVIALAPGCDETGTLRSGADAGADGSLADTAIADGVPVGDGAGPGDGSSPEDGFAETGAQPDAEPQSGRNLNGSHTTRVTKACTRYVNPSGDDNNDGSSLAAAWRTPGKAAGSAAPGDVICFDEGSYGTLKVESVTATTAAPIVFRTVPGKEHKAVMSTGEINSGYGVYIEFSDHIHVYDLKLTQSQKGIAWASCSFGRTEGLLIEILGQEAIGVGRKHTYDGSQQFLGPASHHCDVIGNTVRDTGQVTAGYGEGIYIGTGAFGGDDTHDVFIAYNTLSGISAEGIELKPHTYNLIVRGNLIMDSSHAYNAAITVAVEPEDFQDGNYLIEDNRIYNYSSTQWSVGGIRIGHGNAIIRNNLIWSIDGGLGINTYTTFANQSARTVKIQNNTIWNPGSSLSLLLSQGDAGTGVNDKLPDNQLSANLTDDGSEGSTKATADMFVGPVDGTADAGKGTGSGFELKSYQGIGADLSKMVE